MFENVTEMEKEIETFRKNIVASSELVEGISDLTAATKQQRDNFAAQSGKLLKKLDACIQQFKADHDAALAALKTANAETVSALESKMTAEQKTRIGELEEIQREMEQAASEAAAKSDSQLEQIQAIKTDFSAQSGELLKKLNDCIRRFNEDHDAALAALKTGNAETISALEVRMSADQKTRMDELAEIQRGMVKTAADASAQYDRQLEHLSSECERLLRQMQTTIQEQQTAYLERLQQTEQTIKSYQAETEKKYADFLKRLENTNVDQIFKEVQDLKQSVQTKFMILMVGVGVTLVVTILSLIMK